MNNELFLKSHEQLMELARWVATPIFVVKRENMEDFSRFQPMPGLIITEEMAEGTRDFRPMSKELSELILKTFCESHTKLNFDTTK